MSTGPENRDPMALAFLADLRVEYTIRHSLHIG